MRDSRKRQRKRSTERGLSPRSPEPLASDMDPQYPPVGPRHRLVGPLQVYCLVCSPDLVCSHRLHLLEVKSQPVLHSCQTSQSLAVCSRDPAIYRGTIQSFAGFREHTYRSIIETWAIYERLPSTITKHSHNYIKKEFVRGIVFVTPNSEAIPWKLDTSVQWCNVFQYL